MNNFQRDIISIIKSGLTNSKEKISDDFDPVKAYNFINSQGLAVVFYNGIVNSGIEMDEESQQHFKVNMILYVIQSVKQDGEIKGLTEDFRNNKIDFMPLKGTVIRKLYPDMAMRHMCDSDLLIKPKQYDKIKKIMSDRGYDFVLESDHEFVWSKKDILNVSFKQ